MRCIVCAIAKQENQYIYEWAKHHLEIGFSHLHIYDNNDVDGERIEDVFRGTDIERDVTIHDVRGMKCMQLEVYQECYDRENFDWCAFIDIDEFITFTNPHKTISEFLKDKQEFEAVHLNWLCYGDDEQLESDGRGVVERITHPIQPIDFKAQYITIPENAHIKSIIRKGLKIDWNVPCSPTVFVSPHTPAGLANVCNELGSPVSNKPWAQISHNVCYVAHYITKTITEYGMKVQRRSADGDSCYHSYSRYFRYNRMTIKKLNRLKAISKQTDLISIIADVIKWWNFKHRTIFGKCYKQYNRMINEEKRYEYAF